MTEESAEGPTMHLTKSRLESLSDGVFAFAMTLLVIGINLPDKTSIILSNQFAWSYLLSLYSDFFHYVLAFLILGAFWLSHHVVVHHIRTMDKVYIWLNLVTLLFVALLPFSTSFSGDFPGVPAGAIVFEINLLIIGLGMYFQWIYSTGDRRLVELELGKQFIHDFGLRTLVVPVVSLIGILIALAGSPYSTAVYLLVPLGAFLVSWSMKKHVGSAG